MSAFFYALILAVLLSSLLIGTGRRGPGIAAGFVFYFFLFLLLGWAASLWLTPVGSPVYGVYWVSPLVALILMGLILLAVVPTGFDRGRAEEERRRQVETPGETKTRHAVEAGVSLFFWIAMVGLVIVIIAGLS